MEEIGIYTLAICSMVIDCMQSEISADKCIHESRIPQYCVYYVYLKSREVLGVGQHVTRDVDISDGKDGSKVNVHQILTLQLETESTMYVCTTCTTI